jgi:Arc/MetJ-type ribon-helix-helix transcriptional regulator
MTSSDAVFSMRTIVDLPEPERDQLDALCRQRGLSRAEALRQALRLWLQQQTPDHRRVFGLWRDRPEGSLALQDSLRQEWSGIVDAVPREYGRAISLAEGVVQSVSATQGGTQIEIVQPSSLTARPGQVTLTRLPPELAVSAGDVVAVAGLQAVGAQVLRADWTSTIWVLERTDRDFTKAPRHETTSIPDWFKEQT